MREAKILILDVISPSNIGSELKEIIKSELNFKVQLISRQTEENGSAIEKKDVMDLVSQSDPDVLFLLFDSANPERLRDIVTAIRNAFPELPVVVSIENGDADQIMSLMKCGGTDFITPPVSANEVLPRIWKLVQQEEGNEKFVQTLKRKITVKDVERMYQEDMGGRSAGVSELRRGDEDNQFYNRGKVSLHQSFYHVETILRSLCKSLFQGEVSVSA